MSLVNQKFVFLVDLKRLKLDFDLVVLMTAFISFFVTTICDK